MYETMNQLPAGAIVGIMVGLEYCAEVKILARDGGPKASV